MNIIISGYGKMGKAIEKIALNRKHNIVKIIDKTEDWDNLPDADVIIDFSVPSVAVDNFYRAFESNIPIVSGTTAWYDRMQEIKDFCIKNNHSMLYAANFSIGVNVFFEVNKRMAELLNEYSEYEVEVEETHHINKLDAPSGTAIVIANQLVSILDRKNNWELGQKKNEDSILITAKREENVFGDHSVKYESDTDTLCFSHSAKNRNGFAKGAVIAAEWLKGKKGFFSFSDIIFDK